LFVRQAAPGTPSAPDSAAATAAVHADSLQNQVAEVGEQGDVSPSNRSSQDVQPPVADPPRASKPRLLLALLTPVNLFTGVLSCGLICFLVIWMDRRFLPAELQPPLAITTMNVLAGIVFFALGIKGYWENENVVLVACSMAALFAMAMMIAVAAGPRLRALQRPSENEPVSTHGEELRK